MRNIGYAMLGDCAYMLIKHFKKLFSVPYSLCVHGSFSLFACFHLKKDQISVSKTFWLFYFFVLTMTNVNNSAIHAFKIVKKCSYSKSIFFNHL